MTRCTSLLLGILAFACGSSSSEPKAKPPPPERAKSHVKLGKDQGRCEYEGREDRSAIESRGPGASRPNIRRVFALIGEEEEQRRVLICREVDTNLDGTKDVFRIYNDKGEAIHEMADSDYDGKVDTWIRFADGHISQVRFDRNGDGKPDETRNYAKGKITRARQDTNGDGKPDIWKVFEAGRLVRIGQDVDFDGHVDRWLRDEVARRLAVQKAREQAEKEEAEEEARKAKEEAASKVSDAGAAGAAEGGPPPSKP